jgi:hypothetical protein
MDDSDSREIIAKILRSAPRSSRHDLHREWNGQVMKLPLNICASEVTFWPGIIGSRR